MTDYVFVIFSVDRCIFGMYKKLITLQKRGTKTMSNQEILMQPNNLVKSRYNFTSIENKLFYKINYSRKREKTI